MSDLVNHPKHYNKSGRKECWDEMKGIFGIEAVIIFDVLSAYKYHYRAGEKEGNPKEQDKAKIQNYMNHAKALLDSLEEYNSEPLDYARFAYEKFKNELDKNNERK